MTSILPHSQNAQKSSTGAKAPTNKKCKMQPLESSNHISESDWSLSSESTKVKEQSAIMIISLPCQIIWHLIMVSLQQTVTPPPPTHPPIHPPQH